MTWEDLKNVDQKLKTMESQNMIGSVALPIDQMRELIDFAKRKFKGFEIIDKTTGKPITERRLAIIKNELAKSKGHALPLYNPERSEKEKPLDLSGMGIFLGAEGKIMEFYPDYEDSWVYESNLNERTDLEVRLK